MNKSISLLLGGGQSLGARTALRRTVRFEDLKETKVINNITEEVFS